MEKFMQENDGQVEYTPRTVTFIGDSKNRLLMLVMALSGTVAIVSGIALYLG
jgi:hypothetical protein